MKDEDGDEKVAARLLQQPCILHGLHLPIVAESFPTVHGQDLRLEVLCQLLKHILEGTAAEIQVIIHQHLETEEPLLGMVAIRCQEKRVVLCSGSRVLLRRWLRQSSS